MLLENSGGTGGGDGGVIRTWLNTMSNMTTFPRLGPAQLITLVSYWFRRRHDTVRVRRGKYAEEEEAEEDDSAGRDS